MLITSVTLAKVVLAVTLLFDAGGPDPSKLRSDQFDAWVSMHMEKDEDAGFCQVLVNRMKEERRTSDESVMKCIEKVANTERKSNPGSHSLQKTTLFIDELFDLSSGNSGLQVELLLRKAEALTEMNDFANAAVQFERSVKLSNPLRLSADRDYENSLVRSGESLLLSGKDKDAEPYFLLALSYPWYTIVDNVDELQHFRDLYVRAGRGLIEVHRNDPTFLKSLVFVPAAMNELGPILDQAIRETSK